MKTLLLFAALMSLMVLVRPAGADTCYYLPDEAPLPEQEGMYLVCAQSLIDDMWGRFDFDKGDWDDGMGYWDVCNLEQPLARTINALTLMAWSHTGAPHCDTSVPDVQDWAYCWAGNSIDELDARCGSGSTWGERAYTQFGPIIDNYTRLYWPFFYGETVVQRASTIFHEARHASGYCEHAGNDTCYNGASCDTRWNEGCDGWISGDGPGANTMQVVYFAWFAVTATWTTPEMKASAISEANDILALRFQEDPCFRLGSDGWTYQVC